MSWGFYTTTEAARIARVPRSTVDYWARTKLIRPTHRRMRHRLYSFQDLRDLVAAEQLRKQGARIQDVRAALEYVRSIDDVKRLAQAGFDVEHGQLRYPTDTGPVAPHLQGQRPFRLDMGKVFRQLGADPKQGVEVLHPAPHVRIDPAVRSGAPVIEGTRIPTRLLVELADDGLSADEIARLYPSLTVEQVKAALEWEQCSPAEDEPAA